MSFKCSYMILGQWFNLSGLVSTSGLHVRIKKEVITFKGLDEHLAFRKGSKNVRYSHQHPLPASSGSPTTLRINSCLLAQTSRHATRIHISSPTLCHPPLFCSGHTGLCTCCPSAWNAFPPDLPLAPCHVCLSSNGTSSARTSLPT